MAQIHFQPPDPLNFKSPEDWPRWKQRFDQFRVASGLAEQAEPKQVSTLLYCMGQEAETVLTSTNITDDERKVYSSVVAKFDSFFKVTRKVIFERARFNRCVQLDAKSAEQFIVELYNLAEFCNYGELKAEMIRDRLVVGIRDHHLSERLQLDFELTLEKAKQAIRQRKAVQAQQHSLKGGTDSATSDLDRLQFNSRNPKKTSWQRTDSKPAKTCIRCGKEPHSREHCPARDATCNRCHKR